jgi:hypothetical protein
MYEREEIPIDEVEWNKAEYDTIGWSDFRKIEIEQDDVKELIEKNAFTKEDFLKDLKKASQLIEKPKPSPKSS